MLNLPGRVVNFELGLLLLPTIEENRHQNWARKMSSKNSSENLVSLSQGAGYGVVVGIGLAFGIGMVLVNRFLERYLNEKSDHTEM